jgi:hypothetical protein
MYALVASLALSGTVVAGQPADKGNGLPRISMADSWQVNIHATDTCPPNDYDGTNRRTIVVQSLSMADFGDAVSKHDSNQPDTSQLNDIELASNETDTFQVLDGNACDNDPAQMTLPELVAYEYEVFVKYRGKPGTKLDPALCAEDTTSGTVYCSTGATVNVRTTGNGAMKFTNETRTLLGLPDPDDFCAGNTCDLFEAGLEGYFWDWSATNGAKATVVFVPCATAKSGDDPSQYSCFSSF